MKVNYSGRTEEDLIEMTMRMYKARSGRKDKDGVKKDGAEFKFMDAAAYLSNFPKFGGLSNEAEGTAIKEAMRPSSPRSGFDSDEEVVSYIRPRGVKAVKKEQYRKKIAERKAGSQVKKQENIDQSTKAMHRLADGQERDRRAERNYRLLQMLPKESAPYKAIVEAMLT